MAYMSQETKKLIVEALKPVLKKYNLKATYKVWDGTSLDVRVKLTPEILSLYKAVYDALPDYLENNEYQKYTNKNGLLRKIKSLDLCNAEELAINIDSHIAERFLSDCKEYHLLVAMVKDINDTIKTVGNWYDRSDSMSDYFDTAFYYNIKLVKSGATQ